MFFFGIANQELQKAKINKKEKYIDCLSVFNAEKWYLFYCFSRRIQVVLSTEHNIFPIVTHVFNVK